MKLEQINAAIQKANEERERKEAALAEKAQKLSPQQAGKELLKELKKNPGNAHEQWCIALIDAGKADIHLKDEQTKTLLSLAIEAGEPVVADMLINKGINIESADKHGFTALHYAVNLNFGQTMYALIAEKANLNATTNEGMTPLMIAAVLGHSPLAKGLLEYGAKVDMQSNNGKTALMFAVEGQSEEAVKIIIGHRASTELKDKEGHTALDIAHTLKSRPTYAKAMAPIIQDIEEARRWQVTESFKKAADQGTRTRRVIRRPSAKKAPQGHNI